MLIVMLAVTGIVVAENNSTDNSTITNNNVTQNVTQNQTTNNTNNNITGNTTQNQTTNVTDDNATQKLALNVRYDNLQCKVTFTNTQIDLLKRYIPTIDQTANKNELLSDMIALKSFLDSSNRDGFDTYVTNTLRLDMQNATRDLNAVKKNFKQYNLTNESRTALITELKNARQVYSACVDDKEIKMAHVMETHMENWNRQWNNVINKMSEKNITMADAVALQAEIEAKNAQLKVLIAEGNITKITAFMQTYYEDQLHYAARFEISRLKGYRDKLGPLANMYNMSDKINAIDKIIAGAEKNAKPGHNYTSGEFNNTWSDIKSAGKDMQQAAKDINAERKKEQQQRMVNKTQKMPLVRQRSQGQNQNN